MCVSVAYVCISITFICTMYACVYVRVYDSVYLSSCVCTETMQEYYGISTLNIKQLSWNEQSQIKLARQLSTFSLSCLVIPVGTV